MERIEKTVFLSYRHTNAPWALAIYQNLTEHGYDVFFDYSGIASGDFERVILGNITSRAHFLALLTPSALERCDEPSDWLRREIETALDSQRNIVPLMLEGFDFGTPKISNQLTGKLAALKHYNGLGIPPEYFMEAMERLRAKFLNVPLSAVLHPAPPSARQAAEEQKAAASAAPTVQGEALTAQQWFERGLAAVDLDEQIRFYNEAVRLKPDYAEAFNNRATARYHKGYLDLALEDYNQAIFLKPNYVEALNDRGNARRNKGDLKGALRDFDAALRLKPDFAGAFNNRGVARYLKGKLDLALEDYNQAILLKPDYADAFYNRSLIWKVKGQNAAAIDDLRKYLNARGGARAGNTQQVEQMIRELSWTNRRAKTEPRSTGR
jgi:tetratricopeptide (TPR) repeat protein